MQKNLKETSMVPALADAAIRRLSLATFPIGLQKLLEYESSLGGRCCGRGAGANLESPAAGPKFRETSWRYSAAAARTSVSEEEEAVEGQEEEEEADCERSYQCCCGGGGSLCCGRSTCGLCGNSGTLRSTLGRRRSPATNWDWLRARLVPGALLAITGGGGGKGWAVRDLWLGGTSRRLAVTSGMKAAALLWGMIQ